ncbi:PH domain-containing protein [Arthrobacter sp. NEB 688]|uniref:PH domain-containing protein n=1 Tax=Arthrobacter sp. NEB 688 TaxID=904039 RepID=UPI0015677635|nr:PH domain-containing protein [Arthrobacter sp. NEB 688]QKE84924.1 PH domain-containing protein [Arthrobacter sp. NEB 688]
MTDAPAPDAPFRPRRGRVVPLVVAGVFVLICTAVAVGMGVAGQWGLGDQLALVAFGVAVGAFLARYAAIRATPGEAGLTVRNLMLTRTVGWDEIEAVRFVDGDPWVSLELTDTDVVAVMAVQRVDGDRGRAEADRLLALVRARRRG